MNTQAAAVNTGIEEATVVVDTSVLKTLDPAYIVSKEFIAFLDESRPKGRLDLRVPELVVKEIIRHKVRCCNEDVSVVANKLDSIHRITGRLYQCPARKRPLEKSIDAAVRKWFGKQRILVAPTPYGSICLEDIEHRALHNLSPFEPYDKNSKKGDKGIKDYLILKTVIGIRKETDGRFVFLCRDGLLKDAFSKEIGKDSSVTCYEDLNDYQSVISLRYERYSDEFTTAVVKKAAKKFHDSTTSSGLVYEANIIAIIMSDFSHVLDRIEPEAGEIFPLGHLVPVDRGRFTKSTPKYIENTENKFRFLSRLSFRRHFIFDSGPFEDRSRQGEKRLLKVVFDVTWTAQISSDGRFRNKQLEDIVVASKTSQKIPAPVEPAASSPLSEFLAQAQKAPKASLAELMRELDLKLGPLEGD